MPVKMAPAAPWFSLTHKYFANDCFPDLHNHERSKLFPTSPFYTETVNNTVRAPVKIFSWAIHTHELILTRNNFAQNFTTRKIPDIR